MKNASVLVSAGLLAIALRVPGHWKNTSHGWEWIEGHWR